MFYLSIPYHGKDGRLPESYEDLTAAKAAAAKEYAAKKGIVEEEPEEKETLSGVADRPYCKGRAYDPNRYSANNTEE